MLWYFRGVCKVSYFAQQIRALFILLFVDARTPKGVLQVLVLTTWSPGQQHGHFLGTGSKRTQSVFWQALQRLLMQVQFKDHCPGNSIICITQVNKVFSNMVLGSSSELVPYHVVFLPISTWVHNLLLHWVSIICISQSLTLSHHIITFHWPICEQAAFY